MGLIKYFALLPLLCGCAAPVQKMECYYVDERREQINNIEPVPGGGILIIEPPQPKKPIPTKKDRYGNRDIH